MAPMSHRYPRSLPKPEHQAEAGKGRAATFLVMPHTHATLMNELGVNGKLVANQLEYSLDVTQNLYPVTGQKQASGGQPARETRMVM
jgi:hypothetical protein